MQHADDSETENVDSQKTVRYLDSQKTVSYSDSPVSRCVAPAVTSQEKDPLNAMCMHLINAIEPGTYPGYVFFAKFATPGLPLPTDTIYTERSHSVYTKMSPSVLVKDTFDAIYKTDSNQISYRSTVTAFIFMARVLGKNPSVRLTALTWRCLFIPCLVLAHKMNDPSHHEKSSFLYFGCIGTSYFENFCRLETATRHYMQHRLWVHPLDYDQCLLDLEKKPDDKTSGGTNTMCTPARSASNKRNRDGELVHALCEFSTPLNGTGTFSTPTVQPIPITSVTHAPKRRPRDSLDYPAVHTAALVAGDVALLCGLVSRIDLNGQRVHLHSFCQSDSSWTVLLLPDTYRKYEPASDQLRVPAVNVTGLRVASW